THHERDGQPDRRDGARCPEDATRSEPDDEPIAAEPSRGHVQGERGEGGCRTRRAAAERVVEIDRAPISHGAFREQATEGERAESEERARGRGDPAARARAPDGRGAQPWQTARDG